MITDEGLQEAAADALEQSADWLEANGWMQGTFHHVSAVDGKQRACAMGAIRIVTGVTNPATTLSGDLIEGYDIHAFHVYQAAARELNRCLRRRPEYGQDYASVIGWNDQTGREESEVIAEFRSCAQRLRGQEVTSDG